MTELKLTTSWDDGAPADLRLAELLARHGIAATFFVPVRNREGRQVMPLTDLRSLADGGFEIGAHTLDHSPLPGLSRAEARRQIKDGKRQLEDALGQQIAGFAYPGGHPGRHGRALVAELGFRYARTTRMLCLSPGPDRFRMTTTAQFYPHRPEALARNWLRGGGGLARLGLARRWMAADGLEAAIEAVLTVAQTRGGVFHLWGHSWEIDAAGLWTALDRVLGRIAGTIPPAARVSLQQSASCAS
jgi:peptidoglycan/xylan/chitin deacetylase (PgdA/CDA1 family)